MSGVDKDGLGRDGLGPGEFGGDCESGGDGANDGVVEREASEVQDQASVEGQVGEAARGQATDTIAANPELYALGTKHIYRGAFHKGLVGWPVVIDAVLRGEQSIHEQELVGALQPSDRFEVRPVIKDRLSWVSYDAKPNDLEPTGEVWGS